MTTAEFWVLRSGVKYTELVPDPSAVPRVSMDSTAAIKQTVTGSFAENTAVDLMADRMQIWLVQDGVRHSLGKYIITDMQARTGTSGRRTGDYTAYDLTYLVNTSKTETRHFIRAGTRYTDALQVLLTEAGITDFVIENTDAVLRTDREDWEPGTSRLEICNALLSEINYNSLWMDPDGTLRCTKYRQPDAASIAHTYRPGQYSQLYPENSRVLDCFGRANVFIRVVEDADTDTPLRAESVNDDPESPFSTVNQHRRVVDYAKLNNIAGQQELQAYVDNLKFKSLMATEEVVFYTGPNPNHHPFDTVALFDGHTGGIYAETAFAIDLAAPWKMEHRGKRVIAL